MALFNKDQWGAVFIRKSDLLYLLFDKFIAHATNLFLDFTIFIIYKVGHGQKTD